MATTLDVVNDCLATLGETPLNTLTEPHEFKASAIRYLNKANRSIQAPGWWFNREAITMLPAPLTGHMQLAGDVIKWESGTRSRDLLALSIEKPWIVQRGQRLYDTRNRSYVMTEQVTGEIVREIPFEDLPPIMNDYVAAAAVLKFQSDFDADNSRRQELTQAWQLARVEAKAEDIRQMAVNSIVNNPRLHRIRRVTQRMA